MKEINTNKIDTELTSALVMYKETVSPTYATLIKILNQIPEKEIKVKEKRAIRSPYIWLGITQLVAVCSILFVLFPTISEMYIYRNDPFYSIDKQVAKFENKIDNEDMAQMTTDYNNL
ncbi:TPA: hypothetical protein DEP94_01060 [Candidatus Nomurabacteria bacterium]|nr:hypothetical protein [Candidatus Nomurabacteria bacterium]